MAESLRHLWDAVPNQGSAAPALIPTLALWLPAPLDNVADLPNAAGIGGCNALPVGATIAKGIEAMRRLAKNVALLGRRHSGRLGVFVRHRSIEASQTTIVANRDFAARSSVVAIE